MTMQAWVLWVEEAGGHGGRNTILPKMVILMEMRKKEIGGRRAETEERDSEQATVFSTHFRKQNDSKCNIIQHAATLRNTLQHTATYCNTLQHTAACCDTPQHVTTRCNRQCNTSQQTTPNGGCSLQHAVVHWHGCDTLVVRRNTRFVATCGCTLQRVATLQRITPNKSYPLTTTRCNTLQHAATHCNEQPHLMHD